MSSVIHRFDWLQPAHADDVSAARPRATLKCTAQIDPVSLKFDVTNFAPEDMPSELRKLPCTLTASDADDIRPLAEALSGQNRACAVNDVKILVQGTCGVDGCENRHHVGLADMPGVVRVPLPSSIAATGPDQRERRDFEDYRSVSIGQTPVKYKAWQVIWLTARVAREADPTLDEATVRNSIRGVRPPAARNSTIAINTGGSDVPSGARNKTGLWIVDLHGVHKDAIADALMSMSDRVVASETAIFIAQRAETLRFWCNERDKRVQRALPEATGVSDAFKRCVTPMPIKPPQTLSAAEKRRGGATTSVTTDAAATAAASEAYTRT